MPLTQVQIVYLSKLRRIDLIRRYKAKMGCSQCGENRVECLDLHHLDPSTKEPSLSKVKANGRWHTGGSRWVDLSYERIVAEIRKCEVICSNCHRVETAKQFPRQEATKVKHSPKLRKAEIALGLDQ